MPEPEPSSPNANYSNPLDSDLARGAIHDLVVEAMTCMRGNPTKALKCARLARDLSKKHGVNTEKLYILEGAIADLEKTIGLA